MSGRIVILALLVAALGVWAWLASDGSRGQEAPRRVASEAPSGAGGVPAAGLSDRGGAAAGGAGERGAQEPPSPESERTDPRVLQSVDPDLSAEVARLDPALRAPADAERPPDRRARDLPDSSRSGGRRSDEPLEIEEPAREAGAPPDAELGFEEDADQFDDEPVDPDFDAAEEADEIIAERDVEEKFRRIAELDPDRRQDILVLKEMLEQDPDYEVRVEAAEQLALSDRRAAVNALKRGLDDADPRVVIAVIEAIEFTGSRGDIAALEPLLDDPEPEVRRFAAEAIEFLE